MEKEVENQRRAFEKVFGKRLSVHIGPFPVQSAAPPAVLATG